MRSISFRYIFFVSTLVFSLFTMIAYAQIGTFSGGATGVWTGPKMSSPVSSMSGVEVSFSKDFNNMVCPAPQAANAPVPNYNQVVGGWA